MRTSPVFGAYIPGDTLVHRCDARVKIALFIAFIVALFVPKHLLGMGVVLVVLIALYALAKLPAKHFLHALKPMLFVIMLILIFNTFVFTSPDVALIGRFGISFEGLTRAVLLCMRIVGLLLLMTIFTSTTAPNDLIVALVKLMSPLSRVHFPVEDAALLLSIMLRFIPVIAQEAQTIKLAQVARGARFDQGGIVTRAKAWIPVLVPLFVSLFRRADTIACAMESRGYGLDVPRK